MSLIGAILGNASEMSVEEATEALKGILLPEGETVQKAYKFVRDMIVFTNKRLIFVNKQGMQGKKVEYFSLPYKSVIAFSTENAGTLDLDSELKIWVRGQSMPFTKKFMKGSDDILAIQQELARRVL